MSGEREQLRSFWVMCGSEVQYKRLIV